jgi:chromosome segregation ATPase
MSHEVKQWLAEIKALQQKVAEVVQERDEAYASASNWRNLYETEAKQRRMEAHLSRQTIESLKAELQELKSAESDRLDPERQTVRIQAEVSQMSSVQELQLRLMQTLQDCDRLTQALQAEQMAHAETRKSLTSALGDAIDQLHQERQAQPERKAVSYTPLAVNGATRMASETAETKTLSLELPPIE